MMKIIRCSLIDDDIDALVRLEEVLNKIRGIKIISKLHNPNTVIENILNNKPDIIFIAVEMHNKSGFEIIEELKSKGFHTTFILVTSYDQYAIQAIKNSAFDYLIKPISISELKSTINRFRNESINHKTIDLNKCLICKNLSDREKEVLYSFINGYKTCEIATKLFISKPTVDFHRKNILLKTESQNLIELLLKISGVKYIDPISNKQ